MDPDFSTPDNLAASDYRTLKLSISVGVDLTPLIHFWGIHPVNASQLKDSMAANNLSLSDSVRDFLYRYITLIPKDNSDFTTYAYALYPDLNDDDYFCASPLYGCGWFRVWKDQYNTSHGTKAVQAAESIIKLYYSSTAPTGVPTGLSSKVPTSLPSALPSPNPTGSPTKVPSKLPSTSPTSSPTESPVDSPTSSPSSAPTSEPTAAPISSPTSSPTAMPSKQTCVAVEVSIRTDNYPGETSWTLVNTCTSETAASGGDYDVKETLYIVEHCVSPGAYEFTINDSFGDGICCGYGEGHYSVKYGGALVKYGVGDFGSSEPSNFGSCAPVASPSKAPTPVPTSAAPTSSPTETCESDLVAVEVSIRTDNYPGETSWTLVNTCTSETAASGGDYDVKQTLNIVEHCVSPGAYEFTINDSFGDGICCSYGSGHYSVKYGGALVKYGVGDFGSSEPSNFGSCA